MEALFRAYWPNAHRAAYLVVHDAAAAEDIAQESFLAAIRALERFDRRRPFGPWLHRIVVNRAVDHARARSHRQETELLPLWRPPSKEPTCSTATLLPLCAGCRQSSAPCSCSGTSSATHPAPNGNSPAHQPSPTRSRSLPLPSGERMSAQPTGEGFPPATIGGPAGEVSWGGRSEAEGAIIP